MAYTLFGAYDGSSFSRTAQLANWSSGLYTIQTDLTKIIAAPYSAQDFIDGTGNTNNATNAQYSIRTAVPKGCRGFIPYFYTNIAEAAITTSAGNITLTATHASLTKLAICFYGRFGNPVSPYQNDPYTAGATTAVNPATYGFWKSLGNVQLTASSGGTANVIITDSYSSVAGNATLPTLGGTSNLNRTMISHCFTGTATATATTPTMALPTATATTGSIGQETGSIATLGASEILCFLTYGSTTGSTAVTATAGTIGSHGIACSFVS